MSNCTIDNTVDLFCETVALKLSLFHRLFPEGQHNHLTGLFVEELVRSFISDWIRPYELVTGSLLPYDACPDAKLVESGMSTAIKRPTQVDGIIYDSMLGPCILKEGNFSVIHPAFCRGLLEIKKSIPSLKKLHRHLYDLHAVFMHPFEGRNSQVFAVVVRHNNPEKASKMPKRKYKYHDYDQVNHCPIFLLFDNDFKPHKEAIYKLIEFLYTGEIRSSKRVLSSYSVNTGQA